MIEYSIIDFNVCQEYSWKGQEPSRNAANL